MGAEITNRNGLEKPILEIDNLTVLRSGKLVLKNVNLTVNRGEFVGIVGQMAVASLHSCLLFLEF